MAFDKLLLGGVKTLSHRIRLARTSAVILLMLSVLTAFFRGANDIANATAFLSLVWGDPLLTRLVCGLGMGLGLIMLGRRVVRSVGVSLVELNPLMALSVQLLITLIMGVGTWAGLPLSGTHILVAAVVGVGATKRVWINIKGLREILSTWVTTFPGTAVLAMIFIFVAGTL
jgi:PiT family inorganic phosphate transporter